MQSNLFVNFDEGIINKEVLAAAAPPPPLTPPPLTPPPLTPPPPSPPPTTKENQANNRKNFLFGRNLSNKIHSWSSTAPHTEILRVRASKTSRHELENKKEPNHPQLIDNFQPRSPRQQEQQQQQQNNPIYSSNKNQSLIKSAKRESTSHLSVNEAQNHLEQENEHSPLLDEVENRKAFEFEHTTTLAAFAQKEKKIIMSEINHSAETNDLVLATSTAAEVQCSIGSSKQQPNSVAVEQLKYAEATFRSSENTALPTGADKDNELINMSDKLTQTEQQEANKEESEEVLRRFSKERKNSFESDAAVSINYSSDNQELPVEVNDYSEQKSDINNNNQMIANNNNTSDTANSTNNGLSIINERLDADDDDDDKSKQLDALDDEANRNRMGEINEAAGSTGSATDKQKKKNYRHHRRASGKQPQSSSSSTSSNKNYQTQNESNKEKARTETSEKGDDGDGEFASAKLTNTPNYVMEYPFKLIQHSTDRSSLWSFIKICTSFFINLIFMLPLIVLLAVAFPLSYIYRLTFNLLHTCHLTTTSHYSPNKVPKFLTPIELFWLHNSRINLRRIDESQSQETAQSQQATAAATQPPQAASQTQMPPPPSAKLNSESRLISRSTGACMFFLEGTLSKNVVRDLVQNRLIHNTGGVRHAPTSAAAAAAAVASSSRSRSNAQHLQKPFERLTQLVHHVFGYGYVWLDCFNFNIDEHIIDIDERLEQAKQANQQQQQQLQQLETNDDLHDYVCKLIEQEEFNMSKPLWKLFYKKNFGADNSTVLVYLFHMCFADGVSLIRLFFKGIVDNRNAIDIKPRFAYYNFHLGMIKQLLFGWHHVSFIFFLNS
jgi:hypothetical protein